MIVIPPAAYYTYSDLEGQVVGRDRRVHLLFSRMVEGERRPAETANFILDPQAALEFAELLTRVAFEQDTSLKPVSETLKASLVERHRDKLIPRIALMLNSMRDRKTLTNQHLATKIIDVVFSEVFS